MLRPVCFTAEGIIRLLIRLLLLLLLVYRCLILDSRYLPVNVVSWFRAVVMDASGNVSPPYYGCFLLYTACRLNLYKLLLN